MSEPSRPDLLAGPPATELPADPAAAALQSGDASLVELAGRFPASSAVWAGLAEAALAAGTAEADVSAYAFARTGYHRGLDALRRAGWRGSGPVPWEHAPNRGFLRALAALSLAAGRIGDTAERDRCRQFLRDSSESAFRELLAN